MNVNYENFNEIVIVNNFAAQDNRGSFTKIYNQENFQNMNLVSDGELQSGITAN